MRLFLHVALRFLILKITINAAPATIFETVIVGLTITVLACELHHAITHNELNLRRPVRYSLGAITSAIVLAAAGLNVGYSPPAYSNETTETSYAADPDVDDAKSRRYGLFDEKGRLPYDMLDQFRLSTSDQYNLKRSSAVRQLVTVDAETFGKMTSRTTEWCYTIRLTPGCGDSIAQLFDGFQDRVHEYVQSLPSLMRAIEDEQSRQHSDPDYPEYLEGRRRTLSAMYDSMFVAMEAEASILEKEMLTIAYILSNPSYWSTTENGKPIMIRQNIAALREQTAERALRCLRTINACRDAMIAYYVMLDRRSIVIP